MRLQGAVKKETVSVSLGVFILAAIMLFVFALAGKFNLSVLFGAVFGASVSALNFFLLGITVQLAAEGSAKSAPAKVKLSYLARMLLMGAAVFFILKCSCFHSIAGVLSLFFSGVVVLALNILRRVKKRGESDES